MVYGCFWERLLVLKCNFKIATVYIVYCDKSIRCLVLERNHFVDQSIGKKLFQSYYFIVAV